MHRDTARELEGLLRILDEKGEDALFWFVREKYLKNQK